jgi:hypothetical protein
MKLMKLEIGKRYVSQSKGSELIMGPTRDNPEWVWTARGNWYEQATGKYITFCARTGRAYPLDAEHSMLTREDEADET